MGTVQGQPRGSDSRPAPIAPIGLLEATVGGSASAAPVRGARRLLEGGSAAASGVIGDTRRYVSVLCLAALLLGAAAEGRQEQGSAARQTPSLATQARVAGAFELWQIDLNPTGTGFAVTKPVLEGNVYVFQVWPDRAVVRLPKARVKNMVRRTKDIENEVIYRIDLLPSGQMVARDNPVKKGSTYEFHTWKGGTLMSLRQTDVKAITPVKGMDAFPIHLQQLGIKKTGDLPMQGARSVTVGGGAPSNTQDSAAASSVSEGPYNWIYQGVPGVTDAWAPPSAVVASPGDVPKAPDPH